MSLRINTNVAALNSYNNLNANQAKLEGAFQQLSSGLRINKAADDAAGLSIAAGLTSQINGLTQAVSNANDGINVAQIADGALGTTQDILQRMRSLVVKAGNEGTQDSKSLQAIQKEVNNLNTQLDNIASQTKFGQTNLLDGKYSFNFQVGANGGDTIRLDLSGSSVKSNSVGGVNLKNLNIANSVDQVNVAGVGPAADADLSSAANNFSTAVSNMLAKAVGSSYSAANYNIASGADANTFNITTTAGTVGHITKGANGVWSVSLQDADGVEGRIGSIDTATHDENIHDSSITTANANVAGTLKTALTAAFDTATVANHGSFEVVSNDDGSWTVNSLKADGTANAVLGTITASDGVYELSPGAGAGTNKATMYISSNEFVAYGAGDGVQSYTTAQAAEDMTNLSQAIDNISASRSQIGAVQNQLGYTVSNLQTAITNVTASRSNLTDADLAQQVTAMTQSQILTQAATSVLAQANSAPQAILKLLQ